MSYTFTAEELYEIEKVFDIYAAQNTREMMAIAEKAGNLKAITKSDAPAELVDKLVDSAISAHTTYRTISAKAGAMRKEAEKSTA